VSWPFRPGHLELPAGNIFSHTLSQLWIAVLRAPGVSCWQGELETVFHSQRQSSQVLLQGHAQVWWLPKFPNDTITD
jgi:hypothetical protein